MQEVWKHVPGYKGRYEVSNYGQVMGLTRKKILKTGESRGVKYVLLSLHGVVSCKRIHSLVAETFIGPKPEGHHIRFIDGDRYNCRSDNLEYTIEYDGRISSSVRSMILSHIEEGGLSRAEIARATGAPVHVVKYLKRKFNKT